MIAVRGCAVAERVPKGFSLIELVVTLGLLSLGVPAVGFLFFHASTANANLAETNRANFLASSLLSEIRRTRFWHSAAFPGNGPEEGELNGFSRIGFNDIDDFNVFKKTWGRLTPPRDETGATISEFANFSQYVEVVNLPNIGALPTARLLSLVPDGITDTKLVTVEVGWNGDREKVKWVRLFVNW